MTRHPARTDPLSPYLSLIEECFDGKAWHGPTLRGSLGRVRVDAAAWRPGAARHNIWEIALHAAYWKYIVARRLLGGRVPAFPAKGSNWFVRPDEHSEAAWRRDLAVLDAQHRALLDAATSLAPADLPRRPRGSSQTRAYMLGGIAAHDVYHAGQIQLLKRLRADVA